MCLEFPPQIGQMVRLVKTNKQTITISTAACIMVNPQVIFLLILIGVHTVRCCTVKADGKYKHMVGQCALIYLMISAFFERSSIIKGKFQG